MTQQLYDVFTRVWWREAEPEDGEWPDNLVPYPGEKSYQYRGVTEMEARMRCKQYNDTHDPGRYSLKAEYELA